VAKMTVKEYKEYYLENYNKYPSENLIEIFCKANDLDNKADEVEDVETFIPVMCDMLFGGECSDSEVI
jgi:hypothetical protein